MPTYEYRCKSCDHDFDIVQAFSDDSLTECPECAGPLKKVFGNVGISFKGSGFYKTDSRSSENKGTSENGSSSESKSDTSSDSGSTSESSSSTSTDSKATSSDSTSSSDTKKSTSAPASKD